MIDAGISLDAQLIGYAGYFAVTAVLAYAGTTRARALLPVASKVDVIGA